MTRWQPERQTVRLRNGDIKAVEGGKVTVDLDGEPIPNVPVYGPVPVVGARVLLLEQGNSLVVLGSAGGLSTEMRALKEEMGMLRDLYEQLAKRVRA